MASRGRFASVDTWFYLDPFIQKLAASEWPIYKYCLDGPERNAYGLYEISLETMAFHTRYVESELLRVLDKFADANKIYYVEPGWLVVKNHFKHNSINPSQEPLWAGLQNLWRTVPVHLQTRLTDKNDTLYLPYLDPSATLWLGFGYPSATLGTRSRALAREHNTRADGKSLGGISAADTKTQSQEVEDWGPDGE